MKYEYLEKVVTVVKDLKSIEYSLNVLPARQVDEVVTDFA